MPQEPERTPLTQLLASMQPTATGFGVTVPADWQQGRAIYGGLSAALCLAAAHREYDDLPPLRSALLAFIGPAGDAVELVPTKLRQGKSTAFINVDLNGADGRTAVRANFGFGAARESRFSSHWHAAPAVPAVADCEPFFPAGVGPNFAGHFNNRRAAGHRLVSGAADGELCAWMQHKDEAARDTTEGLVALADAMPPAALSMFTELAPISTMTWMLDIVGEPDSADDGWWLTHSVAQTAFDGYSVQKMTVWNSAGDPVVIGQQTVAVFA